jgi:hypothetical protein
MAIEDPTLEVMSGPKGVSTVVMVLPSDEDRWDQILNFCESPETAGRFSYDVEDMVGDVDDPDIVTFYFSDPDVAFQFKMKFV